MDVIFGIRQRFVEYIGCLAQADTRAVKKFAESTIIFLCQHGIKAAKWDGASATPSPNEHIVDLYQRGVIRFDDGQRSREVQWENLCATPAVYGLQYGVFFGGYNKVYVCFSRLIGTMEAALSVGNVSPNWTADYIKGVVCSGGMFTRREVCDVQDAITMDDCSFDCLYMRNPTNEAVRRIRYSEPPFPPADIEFSTTNTFSESQIKVYLKNSHVSNVFKDSDSIERLKFAGVSIDSNVISAGEDGFTEVVFQQTNSYVNDGDFSDVVNECRRRMNVFLFIVSDILMPDFSFFSQSSPEATAATSDLSETDN